MMVVLRMSHDVYHAPLLAAKASLRPCHDDLRAQAVACG
jgi:hypothetical protein